MRVQMKIQIGGTRDGEPWPAAGKPLDLPDSEATDLIAAGYAVADDTSLHAAASTSPEPTEPEPSTLTAKDVPSGAAAKVLEWVAVEPATRAALALEVEQAKKRPGKKLAAELTRIIKEAADASTTPSPTDPAPDPGGDSAQDGRTPAGTEQG